MKFGILDPHKEEKLPSIGNLFTALGRGVVWIAFNNCVYPLTRV